MVKQGKTLALTTGSDVEAMKESLFNSYFHLPGPPVKKKRSRR